MGSSPETVQQAVADLSAIRQIIERSRASSKKTEQVFALSKGINRFLISLSFVAAFSLLVTEVFGNAIHTRTFLASASNSNLRIIGLFMSGFVLMLGCAVIYFVIKRAAKQTEVKLEEFISTNFKYLSNLSFLSDLIVKFAFFCALILVGRPDWIAPMLSLCTADYLIQGRFFVLPLGRAYLLALVCMLAAAGQLYLASPFVGLPLALFCITCVCSLIFLRRDHDDSGTITS